MIKKEKEMLTEQEINQFSATVRYYMAWYGISAYRLANEMNDTINMFRHYVPLLKDITKFPSDVRDRITKAMDHLTDGVFSTGNATDADLAPYRYQRNWARREVEA